MRTALMLVVTLAACGGADDGGVAPDAAPGPLDGTYALMWRCLDSCPFRFPLSRTTTLVVDGMGLEYTGDTAGTDTFDIAHTAVSASDHCIGVPAGQDGQFFHDAYQLCIDELTATGTVGMSTQARDYRRWSLVGRQ